MKEVAKAYKANINSVSNNNNNNLDEIRDRYRNIKKSNDLLLRKDKMSLN
jgi:hypothetical protein